MADFVHLRTGQRLCECTCRRDAFRWPFSAALNVRKSRVGAPLRGNATDKQNSRCAV